MNQKTFKKVVKIAYSLFRCGFLIGIAYVILFPLIYAISSSLLTKSQLVDPSIVWVPKYISFSAYLDAWNYMDYGNTILYTVKIVLLSTVFQLLSCSLAGYGLARFKFKLRGLFFVFVLTTIILPPQILVVQQYSVFHNFRFWGAVDILQFIAPSMENISLLDTPFTYYIPAVLGQGVRSGLMIYIFRQFFKGIPKELEEAAYIDGCGTFKTFWKIVVPSAAVAFLVVFILSIVWYWNENLSASMFFDEYAPLSLALSRLQSQLVSDSFGISSVRNVIMAGVILFITPVLIVYSILQKYFIQGIERSGIVG